MTRENSGITLQLNGRGFPHKLSLLSHRKYNNIVRRVLLRIFGLKHNKDCVLCAVKGLAGEIFGGRVVSWMDLCVVIKR
jgi:hypothetical protein